MAKTAVFSLKNYQVFQKNRNGSGGGLLTAVDPALNPMLISTKNEEAEILTVQLTMPNRVNNAKIRVINGYGPQNDDIVQNRLNFWLGLEEEILDAKSESCMILIQMDANAKVGSSVISCDPNTEEDGNGGQLLSLVDRQSLVLLNASDLCKGAITRCRVTTVNTETAILDYIIVCQELYQYFLSMFIDEGRNYTLTKYSTTKGKRKKVESDHNPMYAKFNIVYSKLKQLNKRREIFNLKNKECKERFFEHTNRGERLQNCFKSGQDFSAQSKQFMKTLDDALHKSFKKIRIKDGGNLSSLQTDTVQDLIAYKTKLSLSLQTVGCKLGRLITESEIIRIEDDISTVFSDRNAKLVEEYIEHLDSASGNFSQLGMWKLRNKLCQAQYDPPMAKRDKSGTLITAPSLLKKLYQDTYTDRLRNREMLPELTDLYEMKSELWKLQTEVLKLKNPSHGQKQILTRC